MALPNSLTGRPAKVPQPMRGATLFLECMRDAIARLNAHCPDVINQIEFGMDEVPDAGTLWRSSNAEYAIPLASAVDAVDDKPARIVVYRRPLERRASDRYELAEIVYETLVDQIVALTGRSIDEIDPDS